MRVRQHLENPRTAARIAFGTLLLGGVIAGLGEYLRDVLDGETQWTFLFDTVGLIVALIGAAWDFRVQLQFGDDNPKATKRRGAYLLLGGIVLSFGGCWLLGWVLTDTAQPALRGLIAAALTTGIAAVIDGFLHIGWFGGGDYLERRIAQRSEEEW